MTKLFTVGHSNRTLSDFVGIISAHRIELIADIRGGRATSRTFPHFDTVSLALTLPHVGIRYKRIEVLGGRRGRSRSVDPELNAEWRLDAFKNYADYAYMSTEFDEGLAELIKLGTTRRVAYMCSEAVPWRCHRSIVTDYLILVHGQDIEHILSKTQTMVGTPHDFAVRQGDKVIYPSRQEQLLL